MPNASFVLFLFSFFQEAFWLLLSSHQSLRSVSSVRITGHQDSSNWSKYIIIYYLYAIYCQEYSRYSESGLQYNEVNRK